MSSDSPRCIVADSKPWNRRVFDEVIAGYPGEWWDAETTDELSVDRAKESQTSVHLGPSG